MSWYFLKIFWYDVDLWLMIDSLVSFIMIIDYDLWKIKK